MRKIILFALSLCLALSLTACGGNSNVSSNSTPAPPTSSAATSTPEPTPSTTLEPTEPPHTHVWAEANYQIPKTCTECGETEGEPIPAAFVENGYTGTMMTVGTAYDYTTLCAGDPSLFTTGKAAVTDYKVIESYETHEAKEGYEWRIVRAYMEFTDANNAVQGNMYRQKEADYYSGENITLIEDEPVSINYLGEQYECKSVFNILENGFTDRGFKISYEASYLVPVGYDGLLIVIHSAEHETDHNDSANTTDFPAVLNDPNTLFFRLK